MSSQSTTTNGDQATSDQQSPNYGPLTFNSDGAFPFCARRQVRAGCRYPRPSGAPLRCDVPVIRHHYPHAEVGFNAIQSVTNEFGDSLCMRRGVVMAWAATQPLRCNRQHQGPVDTGILKCPFLELHLLGCSPNVAQPVALEFLNEVAGTL